MKVFNYWLLLVVICPRQEEILQREVNAEQQHRVKNKMKKNKPLDSRIATAKTIRFDHSSKKNKKEKKQKKTKKSKG